MVDMLFIVTGGFLGGFVSGLSGFGTGVTALPLWLFAVPPSTAAPLVVICSIASQLQTLPSIWHSIDWRRSIPFIIGGLVGVPIGVWLLPAVSPSRFKLLVAILLLVYCAFYISNGRNLALRWGGRLADGVVGLSGGVCGGLAGLSGPLPTVWAGLRGWNKEQRRGVFQSFNLSILVLALILHGYAGLWGSDVAYATLVALPGTVCGAWSGRRLYGRIDTLSFERVVVGVLFVAAMGILIPAVTRL